MTPATETDWLRARQRRHDLVDSCGAVQQQMDNAINSFHAGKMDAARNWARLASEEGHRIEVALRDWDNRGDCIR